MPCVGNLLKLFVWIMTKPKGESETQALAATKAFYVAVRLNDGSSVERPITNMNAP